MCVTQRKIGVLFGEQESNAFFSVQAFYDFKYFFDQLWRQPHRWFVEQNHFWPRHQRTT